MRSKLTKNFRENLNFTPLNPHNTKYTFILWSHFFLVQLFYKFILSLNIGGVDLKSNSNSGKLRDENFYRYVCMAGDFLKISIRNFENLFF